jgi:hypothetical protein
MSKVDWQKLRADLAAARAVADAIPFEGDGGSANMDSATISIPGARASKVKSIVESAGFSCCEVTRFKCREFLIMAGGGQGDHRTKRAEAISKHLREAGWDASMWWQVD